MLKLGVYRLEQYPQQRGGLKEWLRRDHIDYRLLRTAIPPSPDEIRVFEGLTREMQLASGVFRTTSSTRFSELNEWLNPILVRQFDGTTRLDVQDWAASDCMASLAWHDRLLAAFPQARLIASDVNLYLIEMQLGDGSYVLEPGVGVLQFIAPPFVIRLNPPEAPSFIVNRILARRALARLDALQRQHGVDAAAVDFPNGVMEVRRGGLTFRKIPTVHPHAAERARVNRSFRIERHSVFDRAEPAHIVRTMNILNTGYFDSARIEQAIRSIFETLVPDGIWIVGRTTQEDPLLHHVSVLVRTATGFRVLERYTSKSEIEDLALAVRV
ncbi:MAG TPA: hypothetical protein VEK56_18895 [Vicinamibacterales bacterium]|nr:hypothetical protein [Vicinamibacterales bacterium]